MRALRNLNDVTQVVRELATWKDQLTSGDWDFHGLRIKNASPSKDPNDYVIKKELPLPNNDSFNPQTYYTIVFSCDGTVTTGTDVVARYIVPIGGAGVVKRAYAYLVNVDTVDIKIDLTFNGAIIFVKPLLIKAGEHGPVYSGSVKSDDGTFDSGMFTKDQVIAENDTIGVNVNTASTGSMLTIELRVQRRVGQ